MKNMVCAVKGRMGRERRADTLTRRKAIATSKRLMTLMIVCILVVGMVSVGAFATSDSYTSITEGVNGFVDQMYTIIKNIAGPIAAIVAAWSLLMWLVLADEKSSSSYKKRFLISAICLAGIYLAPVIVKEVITWFSGSSTDTLSTYFN